MDDQSVIARTVTVAGGRYAPGHLGELTQLIPFEMVDAALACTGKVQARVRDLPSRVVVYLLLAACLFPGTGYPGVWRKLTAGLAGLQPRPTAGALAQARRRVGVAPLQWLFDLLRGPAATPHGRGTWWRGLLVCAIDGTTMTAADTTANLARSTKHGGHHARFGISPDQGDGPGGLRYPHHHRRGLRPGWHRGGDLYLPAAAQPAGRDDRAADRNFAAAALITTIADADADVLVRAKNGRNLPVLRRYPDGSCLSLLGATRVRVIDREITIYHRRPPHRHLPAGHHPARSRRYPAAELVRLYHERWEIETAYLEIKSTILGGRVLRARTPAGIDQEIYALLVTYQILRTAMADATAAQPGTDPDRASFSIALHAARDQLIQAAGVIAGTTVDLTGTIGRHILASLLPARRLRVSPRIVKRAISKYQARGPGIDRTSYKATLSIDILAPPPTLTSQPQP